ncbi:MAG: Dabb family protein [Clostridia bacterium]|nr:Dabb family protein [Clostridia bacterium]
MIRHIVLFTFSASAEGKTGAENAHATKEMLDALPAKIPQILRSETHLNAPDTDKGNADLILISDFADRDALNAYIVHPDHRAVGAFMAPRRQSRAAIDVEL